MKQKIKLKLSIKLAFIIMLVFFMGILSLTYLSYLQAKKIFISNTAQLLDRNMEKYETTIKDSINSLKYDITMLSYNSSVIGFFRAYNNKYKYDEKSNKTYNQFKTEIESLFSLMLKQNSSYFQVRIIDAKNGHELLKLERKNNKIIIVPDNKLQNKFYSSYVQGTLKSNNKIYISKIDLNREFHTIEFPIKPTIRVAKLIKINGKKMGIVVINANVSKLFKFKDVRNMKDLYTSITNEKGEYLLDTQNISKEFGFEFGKDYRIYNDIPVLRPFYFNKQMKFLDYNNKYLLDARKLYVTPNRYIVIVRKTSATLFDKKANHYMWNLFIYIILITLVVALITAVIVKKFTKPISELNEIANEIAKTEGKSDIKMDIHTNDEVGELAHSFNVMLDSLIKSRKEVEYFAAHLEKEVQEKTKELQEINKTLQLKVDEKLNEIRKKDKVLIQQSKLAAMGEMIGAIAHQWRQPLNSLGLNIQLLVDMAENNECEVKRIEEFVSKNMKTIQFMSHTIDDFRNFFREDKEKTVFDVKEAIDATLSLQKDQLKSHNIDIIINVESYKIYGFRNELMQVILNLISNSRDIILEKISKNRKFKGKINILDYADEKYVYIIVSDNGGGVPKSILDRVFEPYFTTKDQGKGTGMGLYMSKEIIHNMEGELSVKNNEEGAEFEIRIPLWKE